ncbi:SAM hydrolase/SAM-dependent halogenase family protein [Methanopyrus kandleri]
MRLITLTTDFGSGSPYPAQVKAVILRIAAPGVEVVDVTHEVPAQDVVAGSYVMSVACPWFPPGSVHVGVVDPGVGTERRAVLLETERGDLLVGPDNGLLIPLAEELGGIVRAFRILEDEVSDWEVSATFHGRDVFAPAAARVASGENPEGFCEPLDTGELVEPPIAEPEVGDGHVSAQVWFVDDFGNVIMNVRYDDVDLPETVTVRVSGESFEARHVRTYGEADPGDLIVLRSSSGHLEVAVVEGSAAELLGVSTADRLDILY